TPSAWRSARASGTAPKCARCSSASFPASTRDTEPMPPLIRRYIKTSFVFLIVGVLVGGWVLLGEFILGRCPPRLVITAPVHLLLVACMRLVVMGVATWLSPRPAGDDRRSRPERAETVYWVTTVSTALPAAAELTAGLSQSPLLRVLIAAGGIGQ